MKSVDNNAKETYIDVSKKDEKDNSISKQQMMELLLNSKTPENLAAIVNQLVRLDDAIDDLSTLNSEKLSKLNTKIDEMIFKISRLGKGVTSENTEKLISMLEVELLKLKTIINEGKRFDMEKYRSIKSELPEVFIQQAIEKIGETLTNNPTIISI
jgi:hypothetical protein